jgi:hypothetical protein
MTRLLVPLGRPLPDHRVLIAASKDTTRSFRLARSPMEVNLKLTKIFIVLTTLRTRLEEYGKPLRFQHHT